jgi:hypothetical protein
MRKLGWDSVPSVRCSVLHSLAGQHRPHDPTPLFRSTPAYQPRQKNARSKDLLALGLAIRTTDEQRARWLIGCERHGHAAIGQNEPNAYLRQRG